MQHKKLYLIILLICLRLSVQAQGLSLIAPTLSASCNTTIDVPVKIKNFQSLLSLQFSLGWDTAKLKLNGVSNYGPAVMALTPTNFGLGNAQNGQITFAWNNDDQTGVSLSDSTIIFVLQFNVTGNNGTTGAINFFSNPTSIEAIDIGLNTVPVSTVSGAVNVNCAVSSPLNLIVPTVTDTCYTSVDIPVKVKNFQHLLSLQFSMVWDTSKLSFVGIPKYGPAALALSTSNFGTANTANGNLSFVWNDAALSAKNLADSTILFYLRFNVRGANGASAAVQFSSNPTVMEAIDSALNSSTIINVDGAVNIICSQGLAVNIIAPMMLDTCKTTADLAIKVKNFQDLQSLQFSVRWDTTRLKYVSIIDYGTASLYNAASNFGTAAVNSGKLTYAWSDAAALSQTLADSSTLFILRFQSKGGTAKTDSLFIQNTPTSIEAIDKYFSSVPFVVTYKTVPVFCKTCPIATTKAINLSGCNSVVYKSTSYTSSTVLRDTVIGFSGCDSIYNVVTIAVNKIAPVTKNTTLTGCKSVVYNTKTYTSTTIVSDTIKSFQGCDSIYNNVSIIVSNITPVSNNVNLNGCNSLQYKSKTYTSSTILLDTTKSIYGCDSLYNIVNITIYKITPVTTSNTITGCNTVIYNGKTFTTSTVYTDTAKSVTGCDSLYFTHTITVYKLVPTTNSNNLSGCGSVTYKSIIYTSSKNFTDTTKSVNGCDSVYTNTTITVTPNPTRDTFATKCSTFLWYGTTFYSDTVAAHYVTNNVTNTFSEGFSGTTTVTVPTGWTFSGTLSTYTSAGNYGVASPSIRFALTNDQIITPALTSSAKQLSFWIKSQGASGSSLLIEGYNGTSWVTINNITSFPTVGTIITYNATSTPVLPSGLNKFRFTYTKSAGNISFDDVSIQYTTSGGCDSLIALHLTVKKAITNNINLSGCNSVIYNTKTYTSSTTIRDTVKSYLGCDSVYNVANITVNKITANTNNINLSGCNSVLYNTKSYTSSTTIRDTVKSSQGCDSIYKVVSITVNKITPANGSLNLSGCNAITYKGISYSSSTTVLDTLKSYQGCDSIYLTVNISIGSGFNITGNIKHPVKTGAVTNVSVNLTGSSIQSILTTGSYSLTCLSSNSAGVIKPYKNNDINKPNGVTSLDLALLQSHILQKSVLNSPYKIIAADVNGDGKVTTLDIVYMKRLILGIDTTYTKTSTGEKRLWAFIDSSYKFADSSNPFPYKDSITFSALNANLNNQSFIAVKLGDVNWDWNPASLRPANKQVFIRKDNELIDK